MRNIWAIIVGVVVVAGAGVAIYNAVDDKSPARGQNEAVAASTPAAADSKAPPKPSATFSSVEIAADDFVMGKADAPVTLVEYASLTCPHCASFHTTVLPIIKKDYIDKGLVRLVYRDFPLDNLALTGSVIARCAGRDRYFGFIDALFSGQESWARDQNPVAAMSRIARLGGMSQEEFSACLKNKEITDAVLKQRLEADQKYQVRSTPTVLVNGEKYAGGLTIEQFRAVVAPKLN
jgi:protein-disulfide isomerase